jgi:hypothetical protein
MIKGKVEVNGTEVELILDKKLDISDVSESFIDVGLNLFYNKFEKKFYQVIQYDKCLEKDYEKMVWNDLTFLIIDTYDIEDLAEQRRNILKLI